MIKPCKLPQQIKRKINLIYATFSSALNAPPLTACHFIAIHMLNVYNESVYALRQK